MYDVGVKCAYVFQSILKHFEVFRSPNLPSLKLSCFYSRHY